MTVPASTLRKLAALGLNAEQMSGVLDILADGIEADEARKAAQRERTRRAREKQRNATVTLQARHSNSDDTRGGAARVEDKTSKPQKEPQEENKKREHALAFAEFWSAYPNKTQKPVAEKAYLKAVRSTSHESIMAGLARYIAAKPVDRPWLNPSTFLNQERWADQPANVVPLARGSPPQPFGMDAFLGAVIDQQERNDEGPDAEIEGYPPPARLLR